MKSVVLGFSGGVDSAVAALLLKDAGYEVRAVHMLLGADDADVESAAANVNVPLVIRDHRQELYERVCVPFANGYLNGLTLNPCLLCNPRVKLNGLISYANEIGAEYIATGHYAVAKDGGIYMGHPDNDQSYQLCMITREQQERLLLPLSGINKARAREIAREAGLKVADKPASMEICFVKDNDLVGWLERSFDTPAPGDVSFHGNVIGRHNGIHRYTVGQRWREPIDGRRLYVSKINAYKNEITLALWDELFTTDFDIRDVNWLIDAPATPFRARVRVRHTKWETPDCTVTPNGGFAHITTDTPVRAPAPGQAAAVYAGDKLLGGGIIM